MQKVLETLINLQDVDSHLQRLDAAKGDLPQKVENLCVRVEQTQALLDEKMNAKESASQEKRTVDSDVVILKEKLKKYKVQLYEVKTNKEYDAITLEIETSEQKIDEQEFKSLELEELMTQLDQEIASIETNLSEMNELLVEHKKDLAAKLAATKAEEETLQMKRADMVLVLPKPTLAAYERIRQGRGGVAVSQLINGACSECSSRIPPQRALEIRMMDKINLCEVCGRIVVWKQEYHQVEETE